MTVEPDIPEVAPMTTSTANTDTCLLMPRLVLALLVVARASAGSDLPSSLPVLVAEVAQLPVLDRTRVSVRVTFTDGLSSTNPVYQVGSAELSVRGNSSFHLPKKSYRLEFQDEDGADKKVELFGLPRESDWALYSSATDRTFARNLLAQELWRAMGRYAVRWRFTELFVVTNSFTSSTRTADFNRGMVEVRNQLLNTNVWDNGRFLLKQSREPVPLLTESYNGLYVVMEKIKWGVHRLEIAKLRSTDNSEPEISGGYIVKKDDKGRGERGLLTGQEFKIRFEEPKERELTATQRQWLTKYLDDFEKALYSREFRDPVKGYSAYIDVDSFIDFHWLVEVAKNADGYWFSQYMHKDRGGKLTMGPIWDWDRTFGNPYFPETSTIGWRFHSASDPDYTWYRRLFEDPDFLQRYIDRWAELRTNVFSTSNVLALVDRIALEARPGFERNARRWEAGRKDVPIRAQAGVTHEAEVDDLKRWIHDRLEWIDSQGFPTPTVHFTSVTSGQIAMQCVVGRIFFTLDGSDPRSRGGAPSIKALEYDKPLVLTNGAVLTARAKSAHGLWSAPVVVRLRQDGSASQ